MKTLPQSLSYATSFRIKNPSLGIQDLLGKQDSLGNKDSLGKLDLLGKLDPKIFGSQNLSEGVENFVGFVMGEPPNQHCNNKTRWRKTTI